jgi:S1-C subfamily serine protease
MKTLKDWEEIELYLDAKLNASETALFEQRLQTDSELLQIFLEHKKMKESLTAYSERLSLKQKLEKIHYDQFVYEEQKKDPLFKVFWLQHYKTMAVAASVSLLVAVSTIMYINFQKVQTRQSANFKALRKDMDKIKRSQNALINNLNAPKKVEIAPANYSGTGFALSNNGYFITSLHVIKDADSVFIQNNKNQTYRAVTVFRNDQADIAILKVVSPYFEAYSSLPYSFASKSGNLGEHVFTLGYPREDMVYGEGALSAASGFEGDTVSYQVSIPVNPGNSGGPLLDEKGNIIGLISGKQTETEGAAFAVKSQSIISVIQELAKDSLEEGFKLNRKNQLSGLSRVNQIKMIKDYIVTIKVYNQD